MLEPSRSSNEYFYGHYIIKCDRVTPLSTDISWKLQTIKPQITYLPGSAPDDVIDLVCGEFNRMRNLQNKTVIQQQCSTVKKVAITSPEPCFHPIIIFDYRGWMKSWYNPRSEQRGQNTRDVQLCQVIFITFLSMLQNDARHQGEYNSLVIAFFTLCAARNKTNQVDKGICWLYSRSYDSRITVSFPQRPPSHPSRFRGSLVGENTQGGESS